MTRKRKNFLADLFKRKRASRKRSGIKANWPAERRALRIEPLEERAMLAMISVNSLADGPVDLTDGVTTLRDALAMAADDTNYPGADQITFAASLGLETTPGRITLGEGQLTINSSVTLTGPGADLLTVDGNQLSRVFSVNSDATATIRGLTITGGNAGTYGDGGGVANYGTLMMAHVAVSENTADYGGGVYNSSGTLSVVSATFSGNVGDDYGGGIYNSGGTVSILNSTLTGNTAVNSSSSYGGGVYNSYGTLTVSNCTLASNTAKTSGGGIHVSSGSLAERRWGVGRIRKRDWLLEPDRY